MIAPADVIRPWRHNLESPRFRPVAASRKAVDSNLTSTRIARRTRDYLSSNNCRSGLELTGSAISQRGHLERMMLGDLWPRALDSSLSVALLRRRALVFPPRRGRRRRRCFDGPEAAAWPPGRNNSRAEDVN